MAGGLRRRTQCIRMLFMTKSHVVSFGSFPRRFCWCNDNIHRSVEPVKYLFCLRATPLSKFSNETLEMTSSNSTLKFEIRIEAATDRQSVEISTEFVCLTQ